MTLHHRHARIVFWFMTAGTFLVVAASMVAYVIIDRELYPGWWDYFHINTEMNLPTWWNVVLLAGVGASAAVAAVLVPRERLGWCAVAATGFVLSLDEGSRLHENAGRFVSHIDVPTFGWVLVGAVVAPLGVIALAILTRRLPRRTRWLLLLGVSVYIGAALGLEALSGWFLNQDRWDIFLILSHIEEALEMLACAFVIRVIWHRLLPLDIRATPEQAPGTEDIAATDAVSVDR